MILAVCSLWGGGESVKISTESTDRLDIVKHNIARQQLTIPEEAETENKDMVQDSGSNEIVMKGWLRFFYHVEDYS